ncbi:MAG: YezD family protein [Nitrospiraceae bacterium]
MSHYERTPEQNEQGIESKILLALQGIRYGSVEIIIQDSRVVQIERKEKMRLVPNGV